MHSGGRFAEFGGKLGENDGLEASALISPILSATKLIDGADLSIEEVGCTRGENLRDFRPSADVIG
jgi:hypothetical protein